MTGARLSALRLPLDPEMAVDPFVVAGSGGIAFVGDGCTLVGIGTAATVPLPHGLDEPAELARAAALLENIACDDRVSPTGTGGSGVLAFGALPFDRSSPAALVVPEIIIGIEASGAGWITVIGGSGRFDGQKAPNSGALGNTERPPGPNTPAVRPRDPWDEQSGPSAGSRAHPRLVQLSTDDSFRWMVEEALGAIDRGELSKIVLARQLELTADEPFDVGVLLRRWHRIEPGCTLFSVPGIDDRFVGASPELLVERAGRRVHCRPLAGTTDPNDADRAGLLFSVKDGTEHQLVVDAIAERLGPLCTTLDVPSGPDLVQLRNIVHLGTSLTGHLATQRDEHGDEHGDGAVPSVLELVAAIHPTPAVGGVPTGPARALISRLEPQPRGRYAGPVGYMDARGDGRWVLGIRSVSIRGRRARLTAGAGIVEGSDPVSELAETTLKLNSVLDALAPGLTVPMPGTSSHRVVS